MMTSDLVTSNMIGLVMENSAMRTFQSYSNCEKALRHYKGRRSQVLLPGAYLLQFLVQAIDMIN